MGLRKKKEKEKEGDVQIIKLEKNDVALVLRGSGKSETICTLKGKHTLTPQEEIIIALGGLLQQSTFVNTLRDYFYTQMQHMLSSKMIDDIDQE